MNKDYEIFDPQQLVREGSKVQVMENFMLGLGIMLCEVVGSRSEIDEFVALYEKKFPPHIYHTTALGDAIFTGDGFKCGDPDIIWGEDLTKKDIYRLYIARVNK